MVDIDVDVQHARLALEELEDGEHDVVHLAEARGLKAARQSRSDATLYV